MPEWRCGTRDPQRHSWVVCIPILLSRRGYVFPYCTATSPQAFLIHASTQTSTPDPTAGAAARTAHSRPSSEPSLLGVDFGPNFPKYPDFQKGRFPKCPKRPNTESPKQPAPISTQARTRAPNPGPNPASRNIGPIPMSDKGPETRRQRREAANSAQIPRVTKPASRECKDPPHEKGRSAEPANRTHPGSPA